MEEITKIIMQKQKDLERITEEINGVKKEIEKSENGFKQLKNVSKNLETRMNPLIVRNPFFVQFNLGLIKFVCSKN